MNRRELNDAYPPMPQSYRDAIQNALDHLEEESAKGKREAVSAEPSYLAHSATDAHPEGHPLKRHLEDVAVRASSFFKLEEAPADSTMGPREGALAEWAYRIALYHDAGKYAAAFQKRVRGESKEPVDHATMGAKLLEIQYGLAGRMMAFPVMGHHGGIPNGLRCEKGRSQEQRLRDRLDEEAAAAFQREMTPEVHPLPTLGMCHTKRTAGFELSMALRMLFSALVDADYLDTERYFEPAQSALRGKGPDISALLSRYERHMARLKERAQRERTATEAVNQSREDVRAACLAAGSLPQGFFSLTVPTGGGKTLASLGFALKHCQAHCNLRRIIYAIPYTSIIEQNAKILRGVFGGRAVLEHHSAVHPPEDGTSADLATENWDAPVVVTTNVQLFESLYSNQPSRCRKLHNLRHSVIILDEAQALPDDMLRPCLMALASLVKNHGVTVLLCTATQPEWSAAWPERPEIQEIVPDVKALFKALRRTDLKFLGPLGDEALLAQLDARGRALCIVNARAHAQALYRGFSNRNGVYHLSALMCPKHRAKVLRKVEARLKNPAKPRCILIATPVIEAGVDIDFPVVYRALAGLDSVAQAAGRCNRGGLMEGLGDVCVFAPEGKWKMPPEVARQGQKALVIAGMHDDLLGKPALDDYFRQRFGLGANLDPKNILRLIEEHRDRGRFEFREIADLFGMIQSAGEPLVIPYDEEARAVIRRLKNPETLFTALREARQYSVTVYPKQLDALAARGLAVKAGDVWVLNASDEQLKRLYDAHCGLMVDADAQLVALFP
jgi:CRISPR-associated helicase Cas3/CRISPR-associated endonuclease Cas3-HD